MLTVFESAQFGSIRTLVEDGKVLFCGNDVARALGFTRPKDAVRDHCRGAVKRRLPTEGGVQEMNFIPESDLYRLAFQSKLPGGSAVYGLGDGRSAAQHSAHRRLPSRRSARRAAGSAPRSTAG